MRILVLFLVSFAFGAQIISFDESLPNARNSKIHSGTATLEKGAKYVIAINAGHGTEGGESVMTLSNPQGAPKLTNGTNEKGAIYSKAVSKGASGFKGGFSEAELNLKIARILQKKLLNAGYGVLMLRDSDDVKLDNIARAVLANKYADIHISLHFDSTNSDKGAFCVSSFVSNSITHELNAKNNALCDALLNGLKEQKIKIKSKQDFIDDYKDFATYEDGKMYLELTQSAYSSVPNTDIELGDLASDVSDERLEILASGLFAGIKKFLK